MISQNTKKRYWVMRTDRRNAAALADELRNGRLRQGWGWLPEQDLRVLAELRQRGNELSKDQRLTWPGNRRLLETEPDSIQAGDIIVTPHLPREGVWSVVQVTGPYRYEISDIMSVKGPDYGHVRPAVLLTPPDGISPHAAHVSAQLRKTMRNQGRMWNIDALGGEIEHLLAAPPPPPEPPDATQPVMKATMEALWAVIQQRWHGAEFERPCVRLLEALFGEENVERTAGSGERGADAICTFMDPLRSQHRAAVQIKMWDGAMHSTRPLDQLAVALTAYDGITSGIILTTASSVTEAFEQRRRDFEQKVGRPVNVILRDDLLKLFLANLPQLADE